MVYISSGPNQRTCNIHVAVVARPVYWRCTPLCLFMYICRCTQQQFHDFHLARQARTVQGCGTVSRFLLLSICSCLQQYAHDFPLAHIARKVQGRVTLGSSSSHIGTVLEEPSHNFLVTLSRCQMQRCNALLVALFTSALASRSNFADFN